VRVDSLEPLRYLTAARNNATHWRRWTEYRDNNDDWCVVPGSVIVEPIKDKPQKPAEPAPPYIPGDRFKPMPAEGASVQVNNERKGDTRWKWWEWFERSDTPDNLLRAGQWWVIPDTLICVPHDSAQRPHLLGYNVVNYTTEIGTTETKAVPQGDRLDGEAIKAAPVGEPQ
jgi:hypothetical protein